MGMSLEEFIEYTGAELVAGNLIVGELAQRQVVGSVVGGVFSLNDAGQAIRAELESGDSAHASDNVSEE